jgi:hypothetical protein
VYGVLPHVGTAINWLPINKKYFFLLFWDERFVHFVNCEKHSLEKKHSLEICGRYGDS